MAPSQIERALILTASLPSWNIITRFNILKKIFESKFLLCPLSCSLEGLFILSYARGGAHSFIFTFTMRGTHEGLKASHPAVRGSKERKQL